MINLLQVTPFELSGSRALFFVGPLSISALAPGTDLGLIFSVILLLY